MRRGQRAAVLAAVMGMAACENSNAVTPAGTVLFDWTHKDATRAGVQTASVGARASKDLVVTVTEADAPFTVDLHVETASVDFEEAGAPVHQQSAVALRGTVKDNRGWELSGKCGDGPHYQMPTGAPDGGLVTPQGMIQECTIHFHRKAGTLFTSEWTLLTTLVVRGDGQVTAFPAERVTIE